MCASYLIGSSARLCPAVVKILPRLTFAIFNNDGPYSEAKTALTGGGSRSGAHNKFNGGRRCTVVRE